MPLAGRRRGHGQALLAATGGHAQRTTVTGPLASRSRLLGHAGRRPDGGDRDGGCFGPGARAARSPRSDPDHHVRTGELIRVAWTGGFALLVGIGGSATTAAGRGGQARAWAFSKWPTCRTCCRWWAGTCRIFSKSAWTVATRGCPHADRGGLRRDNPCWPARRGPPSTARKKRHARAGGVAERALVTWRIHRARPGAGHPRPAGAGAAGGLGGGLVAFFGARLRPGIEMVRMPRAWRSESAGGTWSSRRGRIDGQSMKGKVISGVGRASRAATCLSSRWWERWARGRSHRSRARGVSPHHAGGYAIGEALARTGELLELPPPA